MKRATIIVMVCFISIHCFSISAQCQTTISPSDDALVVQYNPTGNYGTLDEIHVCNRYGHENDEYEQNTFIKFDISSIPPGSEIISAKLYLRYFAWWNNDPVGRELTCYRVNGNWNEDSITYDIQPTTEPIPTSTSIVPSSYQWMNWDVTSDVQLFLSGAETNYGWKIMDESFWGTSEIPVAYFHSKENVNFIPYLEITYANTIPTLSEWGLIIFIIVTMAIGALILRKKIHI